MTVLSCERVADGDVDGAIARLGGATLARMPEGRFVEVADQRGEVARRALAYAGIRATPTVTALVPRPGSRAALGRDLSPLPLATVVLDLVHVRPLSLAAETRRLLKRSSFRRADSRRRLLCRDLLRGDELALGWRRRAWTSREALRSPDVRRVLRPIVFDVAAIGAPPEHRALVREGAVARWLFG